jgi:hypothetical protein
VQDKGPGILGSERSRIWERFHQGQRQPVGSGRIGIIHHQGNNPTAPGSGRSGKSCRGRINILVHPPTR